VDLYTRLIGSNLGNQVLNLGDAGGLFVFALSQDFLRHVLSFLCLLSFEALNNFRQVR